MKKIIGFGILLFLLPIVVLGATLEAGEEYTLEKEKTAHDLYAAGGNVIIDGKITGDLVLAGGNILISGTIEQDLFVGGGTVTLSGSVGDDVRVVGGNITITGDILGDLLIAGGQIHLTSGATVHGDVVFAGGNISLNGDVLRDVKGAGGRILFNNKIQGSVNITGDEILIKENTRINGDFTYRSKQEMVIHESAEIQGKTTFIEYQGKGSENKNLNILLQIGIWAIVKFSILFIAALMLVTLFHNASTQLVDQTLNRFWIKVSIGFLILIIIPILSIVLFFTVIGSYFAVLVLVTYIFFLLLAAVFGIIALGAVIERKVFKRKIVNWLTALIGIFVSIILFFIPFIGWFVSFIFFAGALGGIAHLWYRHLWLNK